MEVELKISVNAERISDLISNAIGGGISYWCSSCHSSEDFEKLKDQPDLFIEHENNKSHELTHDKAIEGLRLMAQKYTNQFAAFMSENDDAETADVFIQLCLFKEVVYG